MESLSWRISRIAGPDDSLYRIASCSSQERTGIRDALIWVASATQCIVSDLCLKKYLEVAMNCLAALTPCE